MKLYKMQQRVCARLEPRCWRRDGDGRAPALPLGKGNLLRRGQITVKQREMKFTAICHCFRRGHIYIFKCTLHLLIFVPAPCADGTMGLSFLDFFLFF